MVLSIFASIRDNPSVCQQGNGQAECDTSLQQAPQIVVRLYSSVLGLWYIHTVGTSDCGTSIQ